MRIKALLAPLAIATGLLAMSPLARAAEEETHVFNAALSLTGGCSTSTLDPVPDPGPCPGTAGVDHPSEGFKLPKAVAVDRYGDRYIASFGPEEAEPNEGRIDVFGPDGEFITEIVDHPFGPTTMAVDAHGNLYVLETGEGRERPPTVKDLNPRLVRFEPTTYEPKAGEIAYGAPPVIIDRGQSKTFEGWEAFPPVGPGFNVYSGDSLAMNPLTEGVMVRGSRNGSEFHLYEFSSAAAGNQLLREPPLEGETKCVVDGLHKRLYCIDHSGNNQVGFKAYVKVLDLESLNVLGSFDGSTTPAGEFLGYGEISLAVEEATGHVFVADLGTAKKHIYEFEPDGSLVSTITHGLQYIGFPQIAIDNGAESPSRGTLYVPSGEGNPGHSLAFPLKPQLVPPAIESTYAAGVTESEALLRARIDPKGRTTTYRFQYATEQDFAEEGFAGATALGEGTIPGGSEARTVSAPLAGLGPGAAYRFRAIAESEGGEASQEAHFATYRPPDPSLQCANEALRVGAAADLPDCRAYELVTPADTGGLAPLAFGFGGQHFLTAQSSPAGEALSFQIQGGTIPGMEGTGGLHGDAYLATRGKEGWQSAVADANGTEAVTIEPGSHSPDQGYAFWTAEGQGSKVIEGSSTDYLRYPDGHSELLGRGSLGSDREAVGRLIAPGGRHVIFSTTSQSHVPVKLEPEAPEEGTQAIYDRTIDPVSGAEETHVVSLLPEDVTPAPGQDARYEGASLDGRGVAFRLGSGPSPIYLRVDDAKTLLAAPAGATFEGIAEGGERLFYLQDGDLHVFDAATETASALTDSAAVSGTGEGDVTVVNVSADGSSVYLVSPSVLTEEANPNGQTASKGAENLYLAREGAISFLGRLTERDVLGKPGNVRIDGLGLWAAVVGSGGLAVDPSRATADGAVLLFTSRAKLTAYDPEGHPEVYRYDSEAQTLACLSCIPTGVPASGEASLQSVKQVEEGLEPLDQFSPVANLSPDGRRAFFQSTEPLVLADTDGVQDVYEWEEEGVGSCRTEGGCVYLISSGASGRPTDGEPNYLYAASEGGRDVFIDTSDLLLGALDPDETPSIYDARVDGGFPPPPPTPGECLGEACQPAAEAPANPAQSLEGAGNVAPAGPARCPKGRRAAHRAPKRCHAKHRGHHRPAKAKRRAGR